MRVVICLENENGLYVRETYWGWVEELEKLKVEKVLYNWTPQHRKKEN